VGTDARGDAIAVWERGGFIEAAGRPAGAAGWEPAQKISPGGALAQPPLVGIDAAGDAVAAWRSVAGGEESIEESSRHGLTGAWSSATAVAELGPEELGQTEPALAVAANGAATIVWQRKHELNASSRPPAGPFGGVEKVSEEAADVNGPGVAADAAGDATTVFELESGGKRVIAFSTRPAGGKWSPAAPISEPGNVNVPSVAVDARGDAVAVWENFFEELGAGTMEEHIQVATRPAGTSTWGAPVTLTKTETGLGEPGNQEVAIDGQGDAVAIWGRMHGPAAETIETSQDHALGAGWSAPMAVSGPGKLEEAPQVAVNAAGNAMIAWEREEPGGSQFVEASSGSATHVAWQPAQPVSAVAPGANAGEPDVAMDPQGDAVSVWAALHGAFFLAEAAAFDAAGPTIGSLSIPASGSTGQTLAFSLSASDVWSPLGATTWNFGDGGGASGTSVTHAYASPGTYRVTVTSADVLGNATSAAASVAIVGAGANNGAASVPRLTGVRLTHTRFRVSGRPTAVTASTRRKPPLGTTFQFTLSEPAAVQIAFTRTAPGLRSAGHCVAPTAKLRRRHARPCSRTVAVGRLTRLHESRGADSIAFTGRIGRRALAPGSYGAALTATAAGRTSPPSRLALTIVR
jgi:hypothetical protein